MSEKRVSAQRIQGLS